MEKRADVVFPKTRCDLCAEPCRVVRSGVALCEACSNTKTSASLRKEACLGQDTYVVPQ